MALDAKTLKSASSTMHTYLVYKNASGAWEKLADIKDTPAMGGSPEQIETTTLSNTKSTFVTGVQSMPTFEFTANYSFTDFLRLDKMARNAQTHTFSLTFGYHNVAEESSSADWKYGTLGRYEWTGKVSVWTEGFSVNGAKEMKISVSAETEVEFKTTEDLSGNIKPDYIDIVGIEEE